MQRKTGITRRQFLKASAVTGAGLFLPWQGIGATEAAPRTRRFALTAAPASGGQDPKAIPKYQMPLVIPPAMPPTEQTNTFDRYKIAVRQFQQQILPTGMPMTTVWGYGSIHHPGTVAESGSFNYPSFTIEAKHDRPVQVTWINDLKEPTTGKYLPHLLPVDPTLHWANPPGGIDGRDMRPVFTSTPDSYSGPTPLVTHVHGAHTAQESDGYAEAWYLPAATNIPAGYATTGTYYDVFKASSPLRADWAPGTAVFQYPNDQPAATLWYHDHTLGMTRLNVYAGPAGFYLLRGGSADLPAGVLPGPAPALGDPHGTKYYEIPIAIQDRSFNADGSLFFPASREFFDDFDGPYFPDSDISPIYNPEFFGNTMVVNGRTWPYLEVEPRRYRFRFLNGCNARFLILKMAKHPRGKRPATPDLPFWQIGTEGGFLPAPVVLDQLLMAPAERADLIVDFTNVKAGAEIYLINEGPDEPFGGGEPGDEFEPADRRTTGQVMKFRVVPLGSVDTSVPPNQLRLPKFGKLGRPSITRKLSLNEEASAVLPGVGPRAALLGTLNTDGTGKPLEWMAPITEHPALGATEIWEIYNFTADAHPIHIHQVQFQVVSRQALVADAEGMTIPPARLVGDPLPPEPWERGSKDTVIAYPGQVTRIKAHFDIAGLYAWHCHIVDHEDNEMMRPYRVG